MLIVVPNEQSCMSFNDIGYCIQLNLTHTSVASCLQMGMNDLDEPPLGLMSPDLNSTHSMIFSQITLTKAFSVRRNLAIRNLDMDRNNSGFELKPHFESLRAVRGAKPSKLP